MSRTNAKGTQSGSHTPMDEIQNILMYDGASEGDAFFIDEPGPSLMVPVPHYHIDEYKLKQIEKDVLFPKAGYQTGKDETQVVEVKEDKPSILVTGFGMRNLKSLQALLAEEEEKRLYELYQRQLEEAARAAKEKTSTTSTVSKKSEEKGSETMTVKGSFGDARLQYLMGLEQHDAEEFEPVEAAYSEKDEFVYSPSVCMRKAQKYLRIHRIFDFFQYIIANLLSATPDNPITYILELLNQCLLYRSGTRKAPTLYEGKHYEQLFYLMDRLNTGFIDVEQYHQGMKTFGLCEYNNSPRRTSEGISKDTFMEEAEEAQVALFDDLIQRKVIGRIPKEHEFQPTKYDTRRKLREKKSTYFMPDDLFKSYKKEDTKESSEDTDQ